MVLVQAPPAAAATILDVVGQVNVAEYQDLLDNHLYAQHDDARGFGTSGGVRYPSADHDPARDAVRDYLSGLGLATSLDPFTFTSGGALYLGCNNVVAVQPGKTRPNDIYILGAHYDSLSNPGADDNASGVAGVLEAARVLSHYQFQATLVYIAFDGEEKGLFGSDHYAAGAVGDRILGMVSLDMIAYNPPGADHDRAYVYGRDASDAIKHALAGAVTAYGHLAPEVGGDEPYSDHAPFEARGFQAALLIEHAVWSNPNYHTPADSVNTAGYIDYAYAANMTRGAVGWAATAAGLVPEPATILMLTLGALALLRRRRAPAKVGGCQAAR
jgi:Zn-dependent M28 family amino/carboxypeptidase